MNEGLLERREQPYLDMERIPRAETNQEALGYLDARPSGLGWVLKHATSLATVEMAWLQLELNGVPVAYPDGKMVIAFVDKRHGERLRDYLNEIGAFPSAT